MNTLWRNYKFTIITLLVLSACYGGYRGFVVFQSYEQNQINAAVQARTGQLEQTFITRSSSSVQVTASDAVDARVNELQAEIQQLKSVQAQSPKKNSVNVTTQIATLQKQVTALQDVPSNFPVITFVNPTIMISGYQNTVSVNGSGFESGAQVTLGNTSLQMTGAITPTSISAQYPSGFNPGLYDVTVKNPDGGHFTFPGAINIRPGSPTVPSPSTLTTAQIVTKLSPSVVLIRTNLGCGSGMVVQGGESILTDDHVVKGTNIINVIFNDGTIVPATIRQENSNQDLALLQVNKSGLSPISFGDSNDASLPLGSNVVSLGFPKTCNTDQTLEVEAGIITARRTVVGYSQLGELLQTSALINPGDSGGPLVDQYGNVVGINELDETLKVMGVSIDVNVTGISYATPADAAESFLGLFSPNNQSISTSSVPITNNQGILNISVAVDNSQGGAASPSSFVLTVIGSNPVPPSFPGGAAGTQVTINPNTVYGVNISPLADYMSLNNGFCQNKDGIPAGTTVNCSFTEVFVPKSN
jgi:S1-C subfamily serine protease